MRGFWLILSILSLLAMVWSLAVLGGNPELDQAGTIEAGEAAEADDEELGQAGRVALPDQQPREDPKNFNQAGQTRETTKHTPAATTTDHNLVVQVFDRISGQSIKGFRYVLLAADTPRRDRVIDDSKVQLTLPPGKKHRLRIEAPGYEPLSQDVMSNDEPRQLRIELLKEMKAAGIELHIQDPQAQPIRHILVTASRSDPNNPQAVATALWQRRTRNERGIFTLPQLEPGSYRFDLQALTDTGERTTHLTARYETYYGGSERQRVPLTLAPGAGIDLRVKDSEGTLLGQEVAIRLVRPDGSTPPTRWRATVDDKPILRVDGLPAASMARLAEPVPPGLYRLEFQRGAGAVTKHPVQLEAGRHHRVEITLGR